MGRAILPLKRLPDSALDSLLDVAVIPEASFIRMLRLERRRTERSGRQFMLVLISYEDFQISAGCILLDHVGCSCVECDTRNRYPGLVSERGDTGPLDDGAWSNATAMTASTICQKDFDGSSKAVSAGEFRELSFQFRLFPKR